MGKAGFGAASVAGGAPIAGVAHIALQKCCSIASHDPTAPASEVLFYCTADRALELGGFANPIPENASPSPVQDSEGRGWQQSSGPCLLLVGSDWEFSNDGET